MNATNTVAVNSLLDDIDLTNRIKNFRRSIGSTQQTRNPYNWWQAALTAFTYPTETDGMNLTEAQCILQCAVGMEFGNFNSRLLVKAVDGASPDPVQRQYSRALPCIVESTRLRYRVTQSNGQRSYIFYYVNPQQARNVLITSFPELLSLFTELDRFVRQLCNA